MARRTPGTTSPSALSARLVTRIEISADALRSRDPSVRRCAGISLDPGEVPLGSRHADAQLDRMPRIQQGQLGAGEGREDLQLIQRAEVTDAEDTAAELTEADAECEVQTLGRHLHDLV